MSKRRNSSKSKLRNPTQITTTPKLADSLSKNFTKYQNQTESLVNKIVINLNDNYSKDTLKKDAPPAKLKSKIESLKSNPKYKEFTSPAKKRVVVENEEEADRTQSIDSFIRNE